MKTTKIIYWTTTILFAGFMTMSAIPNIMSSQDSIDLVSTHLGYPLYFIPFIGVAKLLGSIAIIIPAFKKLKEWAYAGLSFDLIAATYSMIYVDGFAPSMLFMVVIFGVAGTSYVLNAKLQNNNA